MKKPWCQVLRNRQKKASSRSTTGLLGAFPHRDKFQAKIQINKKVYCLGSYDSAGAAHTAYLAAKKKLHVGYVDGK